MTPTTKELAKKLDRLSDPRSHMPDDVRSALRAAAARLRELEGALVEIGELVIDLSDGLEDEGDRVFLKSTNDGDRLRQASFAAQTRRYAHAAQLTEPHSD